MGSKLPSNGYGLEDTLYDSLVDRFYGFEEYYHGNETYHDDAVFVSQEIDKIFDNIPMEESYRNAIIGWLISFNALQRKLNTACITVKITNDCQLKCKHCYQQELEGKKYMTFEEFVFLYNKHLRVANSFPVPADPVRDIVFEGGEATLNKDLIKMVQFVNSKEIGVTLLTNGIYMHGELLRVLKHPKNRVQVSIDGFENTHDFIRGKGTFKKSLRTIELLRNNGIPVYCNFVANDKNYKEFPHLKQFFDEMSIPLLCMLYTQQNTDIIKSLCKEEFEYVFPYLNRNTMNHAIGTPVCNEGMISSITEYGDFVSCRRIMNKNFYSVTNYFRDTDEESVVKIKKYAIRSRSVPVYCFPCKKVHTCLGGMLCTQFRKSNKFNMEDEYCHILNKAEF